jgi:hypothetical protein
MCRLARHGGSRRRRALRLELDGRCTTVLTGLTISNGIG